MSKTLINNNSRTLYIEVLRIIAIFLVVFNHTNTDGFFLFSTRSTDNVLFYIDLFIGVFCKAGVPIFFAISGALLLNKEETISSIWKKRIFKMLFILIFWSAAYYIVDHIVTGTSVDFTEFITLFYRNKIKYHFWYMYTYIGFLIGLPFLRAIVKHLDEKHYFYLVILAVFYSGILPTIEYCIFHGDVSIYDGFKPTWLIGNMVLYPLIGYYIHNYDTKKMKLGYLWIINVLCILVSVFMTEYLGRITGELKEGSSQKFFSSFALVNAIVLIISIKRICENRSSNQITIKQKIICCVGVCTFGVYLIHPFFKDFFRDSIMKILTSIGLTRMISCLFYVFINIVACSIVTFIFLKIPIIKVIFGGKIKRIRQRD